MASGFTRAQLQAFRGRTVPDLVPQPLRLLFVGINPGLWSAAVGTHFAHPGNRFYPALAAAGITSHVIDASHGYPPEGLVELERGGVGISNLAREATTRADELDNQQLIDGLARIRGMVRRHHPKVVAFLGIGAYRVATGDRHAKVGEQALRFGWGDEAGPGPEGVEADVTDPEGARPDGAPGEDAPSARVFALPNPSGLNAHETVESLGREYRAAAQAAGVPLFH